MKVCKRCNVEKEDEMFYIAEKNEDKVRRYSTCKECVLAYNREKYATNPSYREKRKLSYEKLRKEPNAIEASRKRSAKFYKSVEGRAMTLFKSAQRRSNKFSEKSDIDLNFIIERLETGVCEVTGLPFDFNSHPVYKKNPYAPSIDRIDSCKGYTKDNVRIVLWQVNLLRGEMTDEEVLIICEKIVERGRT